MCVYIYIYIYILCRGCEVVHPLAPSTCIYIYILFMCEQAHNIPPTCCLRRRELCFAKLYNSHTEINI